MTRILLRRSGALGDVLCATPVIRALRETYGRYAEIIVETGCHQALVGNPDVTGVFSPGAAPGPFDRAIDLDLAYERRPTRHIVDAYLEEANLTSRSKRIAFGISPPPPKALIAQDRLVTIHAARSWSSRTMPDDFWNEVILGLVERKFNPLLIGGGADFAHHTWAGSAVGQTNLRETAELIAASCCLICSDSAMLHLAGATDTPIVGLFTSVRSAYRIPYRHGELGWKVVALEADVPCRGCLADYPPPVTNMSCRHGTDACVRAIQPADVLAAVEELTA